MRKLVGFFIKQPIWANVFIVVTVMFGLYNVLNMKKSFFPELDPRTVIISVVYPGASPEEMEEGVTIKIEQALRGIDGIDNISSSSSENMATIRVKGLETADMEEVYKDVETAVSSISQFPDGAEKPTVTRLKSNPMSEMVMILGVDGEGDLHDIKQEADRIENDLFSSGLISTIEIRGMPELELAVEMREADMLRYNMLFDEVSLAIQRANLDLTGGVLRGDREELVIRSMGRTTDPEEIEKIIVRTSPTGDIVRIGDVADVSLLFAEGGVSAKHNGNASITMEIKKTPDQDLGAITDYVNDYVVDYNEADNPCNVTVQYEFMASLQDRINLLSNNGLVGLLLVLLMLGLFLSTKLSGWVAFGIPFSFLGMFIIANMMGLTINMISLFGMILVVGILVDDGIVIAENIFAHFERGKSPYRAALDGAMEVMPSVFTSVLTTIAAFSILLSIDMMEMMREMPIVVILALAFSLIEAFIILPVHLASKSVLSRSKEGTFRHKFRTSLTNVIDYLRDKIFADVLNFVVARYRAFLLLPLIFVIAVIVMFRFELIGFTFFPEVKPDRVNVEVSFVPGTAKEVTAEWVSQAEKCIIDANEELAAATGDTLLSDFSSTIGFAQSLDEIGSHAAMFTLAIDGEGKATPVDSLNSRIRKKIMAIDQTKFATSLFIGNFTPTFGKPIEFSITGKNDDEIRAAKDRFKEYLSEDNRLNNLKDNEPLGRKEILLKMKPEADLYGLGVFEVSRQVRQGVFGQEVQRVIIGTDEVKVWTRYKQSDREGQDDLENIRIKSPDGSNILLSEIATYDVKRGPISLRRRDGRREIIVDAGTNDAQEVGTINADIIKDIVPAVKKEFPTIEIIQRGQGERSSKALTSMQLNVGILFIIMILIMTLNFRSLMQALMILIVIPAGIAGGILGHALVGMPVSILSAFGMIALLGVLINDSIVFLDTYNRNILDGMDRIAAAKDAARSRFRPILLTSVTTVAGLLPLILETSFQAQFLIPMAVAIAFGILFGTIFILFFFPAVILVANDVMRAFNAVADSMESKEDSLEPESFATRLGTFLLGILRMVASFWFYVVTLPISFILPKLVVDRGLKGIWKGMDVPEGEEIEPVIINRRKAQERGSDL